MAVASPAANWLSRYRMSESQGAALPGAKPPAWIFLHGRRSELSSTMLRQQAERERLCRITRDDDPRKEELCRGVSGASQ